MAREPGLIRPPSREMTPLRRDRGVKGQGTQPVTSYSDSKGSPSSATFTAPPVTTKRA